MSSGKFKTAITKERKFLIATTEVDFGLWHHLLDAGILTQEIVNSLKNKTVYGTTAQQVERLLELLINRDDRTFERFCNVLDDPDLGMEHVAKKLRQAAASTENSGDNNIASSQRSPFSGPAVAASSKVENNATDARADQGLHVNLPITATSTLGAGDNPNQFSYTISGGNNYFVVIHNYRFKKETTNLKDMPLDGARKDDENLRAVLKGLNFRIAWYENKTKVEMSQALDEIKTCLDSNGPVDCFGVAVLSHGDDNGRLYGSDGHWMTDHDVVEIFKNCDALVGKPKVFIFNACRGSMTDSGQSTAGTGVAQGQRVPVEADYLYVYATVPGYYSYIDNVHGSVFIHCLRAVFNQISSGETFNFIFLLTRINYYLAYEYVTASNDAAIHNKKMISIFSSTLSKDLCFDKI